MIVKKYFELCKLQKKMHENGKKWMKNLRKLSMMILVR